jgi:aminoglycoside phosphotransferase (APT) family kinase protein
MQHATSSPADDLVRIRAWIEANLGGSVSRIERLSRWRPAWEVEVERSGEKLRLHVRGDREAGLETNPLRREYEVLRELARNGIAVPRIYGWCELPQAIVMEHVPGVPYEGGADHDPIKRRAVEGYLETLAAIHQLDVAPFAATGLTLPSGPEELALAYFRGADAVYRKSKSVPEPLIEFVRKWILRNIPRHRSRPALLTGDAPQFMHVGARVSAFIDLEMAIIGDPMADLASMRLRDTIEPTGNLGQLYAHYEAKSGMPLDRAAIDFHTVVNFIAVPMITGSSLRTKRPHPALVEFHSHYLSSTRCSTAAIAGILGVELPPVPPVEPKVSRHADLLSDLVAQSELLPTTAGFYRQHPVLSLALYAQRADSTGPSIDALELEELADILGHRPTDHSVADAELERFVLSASPAEDEKLVRYFHRREMRRFQLIADYPSPIIERGLAPIDSAFRSA